jgi:hypothetical protein
VRFEQEGLRPLFASEAQEEGHARGRKYCLADGEGDNGPKAGSGSERPRA